jgi:hypothetical protein
MCEQWIENPYYQYFCGEGLAACGHRARRRQVRCDARCSKKLQEDAGIDIVTDGEQSRQHSVHGFLERLGGIDFAKRVEIGIRADRYKAMVPSRRHWR